MKCGRCKGEFTLKRVRFCPFCGKELLRRPDEQRTAVVACLRVSEFAVQAGRLEPVDLADLTEQVLARFRAIVSDRSQEVIHIGSDGMTFSSNLEYAQGDEPVRILEILDAMQTALLSFLSEAKVAAAFRAGVAVGPVLVGGKKKSDRLTGAALEEAQALLKAASPNSVYVNSRLAEMADRFYLFEPTAQRDTLRCVGRRPIWRGQASFVGREKELSFLRETVEVVGRERKARSLLIEGEAGVGKSRLLYQFRQWLDGRSIRHFTLQLEPPGRTFHLPFQALMRRLLTSEGLEKERSLSLWKVIFDEKGFWDEIDTKQIGHMVAAALASLAEKTPTVLMVEDMHRITPSSWAILDAVREQLQRHPFLLVGAGRRKIPGFGEILPLSGLEMSEALALLERETGESLDESPDWKRALKECAGNPLFILELSRVRAAPVSLEPLLRGRTRFLLDSALDGLSPQLQELVKQASLFGSTVPMLWLAKLSRKKGKELFRELEETALFRWDEQDVAVFRHDLFQETAYERIDPAALKVWHEEAGRILKDSGAYPEEIAHHYLRSGDGLSAYRYALFAARRLSHLPRQDEALEFLGKAEDLARKSKQSYPLANVLELRFELESPKLTPEEGESRLAEWSGDPLLKSEPHMKDRFNLMRAHHLYEKQRYERAEAEWKKVGNFPTKEHMMSRGLLGAQIQASLGKRDEAIRTAMSCLKEEELSPAERGNFWVLLGRAAYADSQMMAAADFYGRALADWRKGDDLLGVRKALRNLGNTSFANEDYAAASANYQESCELCLKLGDLRGYIEALMNLGHVHEIQTSFETALLNYERAFDMSTALRDEGLQHQVHLFWGELLFYLGDRNRAAAMADSALPFFRASKNPYFLPKALRLMADMLSAENSEESLRLLDEAIEVPQVYADQLQSTWLKKAEVLVGVLRWEEAQEALQELLKLTRRGVISQRVRLHRLRVQSILSRRSGPGILVDVKKALDETREKPDLAARLPLLVEALEYEVEPSLLKEARAVEKKIRDAIPESYQACLDHKPYVRRLKEHLQA